MITLPRSRRHWRSIPDATPLYSKVSQGAFVALHHYPAVRDRLQAARAPSRRHRRRLLPYRTWIQSRAWSRFLNRCRCALRRRHAAGIPPLPARRCARQALPARARRKAASLPLRSEAYASAPSPVYRRKSASRRRHPRIRDPMREGCPPLHRRPTPIHERLTSAVRDRRCL